MIPRTTPNELTTSSEARISVIIPTRNEESQIEGCLDSAWAAGPEEVIVVDGGSHDATVERAVARASRVLTAPAGRAVQQNAGAAVAGGDVLLFLHADNRLSPGAIVQVRSLVERQAAPVCGAFRQRISLPGIPYRLLEHGNAFRARRLGIPYGDQAIFLSRNLFQSIGGFPALPIMEDLALMWQVRRICHPCLLDGPVYVSPRRWEKHGLVRQTLQNWAMAAAWMIGIDARRLAKFYREHNNGDHRVTTRPDAETVESATN